MKSGRIDVDGVLGPGGALAAVLPGYEPRESQLVLARAVERALEKGQHLLAEAGTGTGKTLAYLVPALLSGKKVVVSTATRTLQDQVFFKDLPLLREGVGLDVDASLLKGRSNYLCAQRFEAFEARPLFASPDEATHWPAFRDWALQTQSGDRAETQLPDQWTPWLQMSTTSDNCLGGKCPLYEPCFVTRARKLAQESKVIVVNHALFFADLALRTRGGDETLGVLPSYDAVVFDEAHALEDGATEHFGIQVSSARMLGLSTDALKAPHPLDENVGLLSAAAFKLRDEADKFFGEVARVLKLTDGNDLRVKPADVAPLGPLSTGLFRALDALAAAVQDGSSQKPQVAAVFRRARDTADQLDFLLRAEDDSHVYWASKRGRTVWLRAAPIDVGETLEAKLYDQVKSVIFTSATLASSGRFDFAAQRFGLAQRKYSSLQVSSPFDYRTQAALYLPRGMPEPAAPGYTDAVVDEVLQLLKLTHGRAFVLFTSLRHMEQVHARVAPLMNVPCLLQGNLPRRALLEEFVKEPSVLFGSASFWEGVDVPGDALSLVIIDKLPFAPPNEPLTAARVEALTARGEDAFRSYQVPRAALALRQGFGRLVRTRKDRGIVALLDARLTTKSYGQTFLENLPPARRLYTFDDVARWFTEGAAP